MFHLDSNRRSKETSMRAMQVNGTALIPSELADPKAAPGEVLIRVCAAGVTPTELGWYPTTHTKEGNARRGAVPAHEFSGVVAGLGEGASGFTVGQEVYGMNDWFVDGATAELCRTLPAFIAPKPIHLTHEEAASVPISALTAWQGLFSRAKLQPGERVLIHGGSGAVGLFALQLARHRGAHVITTASHAFSLLADLGAAEVLDYRRSRFEDQVGTVDVVLDTVGGETLDRSWNVLKPGGRMVTIASGGPEQTSQRVRDAFFIVEPNRQQLEEISRQLDAGTLRPFVNAVVPFDEAPLAYSRAIRNQRGYGKTVVVVSA